jgi:phage shock protein A
MKEKDDAVSQVAGLNKQISDLTAERDTFKDQVSTLTTEVSGLKDQVTGANDRATKAEGRTTLIESFAKHNGLDLAGVEKFKAVTEVPEAGRRKDGKALYDQWQKLKASGDGKKATAFFRKHKAELNEYAESTR